MEARTMKRLFRALLLGASASAFAAAVSAAPASGADAALIQHGEYLARAGDCMACHTAKGGKPFAGGVPLATPIGTIYSTNITPDAKTGIGGYTYDDFDRALRHGVAKAGYTLYPAMPYPSYAKIRPDDVRALYAYFMHGVAPVDSPARQNGIPWPLSIRWPLGVWRSVFAPAVASDVAASPADNEMLARGRYLVEGLGHCGACHTARGVMLQEKALTDGGGPAFLNGGTVEQWFANDLRSDDAEGLGAWSTADIAQFLKSGRNAHSAAFGGMRDVVVDSTQYLSDDDLTAIATYLKSLAPAAPAAQALAYSNATAGALRAGHPATLGARLFIDNCAACHRTDGKGYAEVFPSLALSSTVNAADPVSLIHIVLDGSTMPGTASAPTQFTMPGFAQRLSDEQVAEVVTFIRSAWGNRAPSVSADDVRKARGTVTAAK
jgi:mono/diheme cytochrome c family protein